MLEGGKDLGFKVYPPLVHSSSSPNRLEAPLCGQGITVGGQKKPKPTGKEHPQWKRAPFSNHGLVNLTPLMYQGLISPYIEVLFRGVGDVRLTSWLLTSHDKKKSLPFRKLCSPLIHPNWAPDKIPMFLEILSSANFDRFLATRRDFEDLLSIICTIYIYYMFFQPFLIMIPFQSSFSSFPTPANILPKKKTGDTRHRPSYQRTSRSKNVSCRWSGCARLAPR